MIAGDSVTGDSLVWVDGVQTKIEELYDRYSFLATGDDKTYVLPTSSKTYSINPETKQIESKKILHVMKHRVKKEMFRITVRDKSVIVTEDHSIIVLRDNEILSVKPKDIKNTDKLIRVK